MEFFDSKVSLKAELLHLLFKHFPSWFGQNFEQQKKLSFISAIYRGFPTSTVSTSMISTNTIVSLFMNMLVELIRAVQLAQILRNTVFSSSQNSC